jgi:hypothetical protein
MFNATTGNLGSPWGQSSHCRRSFRLTMLVKLFPRPYRSLGYSPRAAPGGNSRSRGFAPAQIHEDPLTRRSLALLALSAAGTLSSTCLERIGTLACEVGNTIQPHKRCLACSYARPSPNAGCRSLREKGHVVECRFSKTCQYWRTDIAVRHAQAHFQWPR